ncbi:MAG: hypothetical protein LM580_06975, partial [Thermofilum sp.]|nr:hypothetical protein [Thermofilum sp.]
MLQEALAAEFPGCTIVSLLFQFFPSCSKGGVTAWRARSIVDLSILSQLQRADNDSVAWVKVLW